MKMNRRTVIIIRTAYGLAILVLMALAIPAIVPPRHPGPQAAACMHNLRIIQLSKQQWATAHRKTQGDAVVVSEVNQYIKGLTTPHCPRGGTYTYHPIGTPPGCSCPVGQLTPEELDQ